MQWCISHIISKTFPTQRTCQLYSKTMMSNTKHKNPKNLAEKHNTSPRNQQPPVTGDQSPKLKKTHKLKNTPFWALSDGHIYYSYVHIYARYEVSMIKPVAAKTVHRWQCHMTDNSWLHRLIIINAKYTNETVTIEIRTNTSNTKRIHCNVYLKVHYTWGNKVWNVNFSKN